MKSKAREEDPIILAGYIRHLNEMYVFRTVRHSRRLPVSSISYQEQGIEDNCSRTLFVTDGAVRSVSVDYSPLTSDAPHDWVVSGDADYVNEIVQDLHSMNGDDKRKIRESLSDRAREPWDFLMGGGSRR